MKCQYYKGITSWCLRPVGKLWRRYCPKHHQRMALRWERGYACPIDGEKGDHSHVFHNGKYVGSTHLFDEVAT